MTSDERQPIQPSDLFLRWFFSRPSSAGTQVAALDGLRGVAVLFVLFSHLDNMKIGPLPFFNFSGSGKYGVFLFFVLSAFLLTGLLLAKPAAELWSWPVWRTYVLRRVLRIFPLYTLVLATNALLHTLCNAQFSIPLSASDVWRHITLQAGYGVFWTIPVECKYYMVMPGGNSASSGPPPTVSKHGSQRTCHHRGGTGLPNFGGGADRQHL